MPLTRNLYREDEVAAALMYSTVRGRSIETAFWCLELLESDMAEELIATMRQTWSYSFGIKAIGWLRAFQEACAEDAIDPDLILRLVVGLCRIGVNGGRDRSIPTLLATSIESQPDRVNTGVVSAKYDPLQGFVSLAILQRKTLCAWGGLQGLEDPDSLLRSVAMSKHGVAARKFLTVLDGEPLLPTPRRAITVAALCLNREEFQASWTQETAPPLIKEVETGLKDWAAAVGRHRRVFSVPRECLYWFTERGKNLTVYQTNEKEIMGRLEKPGALWGSTYWDENDWQAVKSDDEVREAFYDEHFPDDRPDEWSSADRVKSHGAGVLQPGAEAEENKALQGLLGRLSSAVIWGPLPTKASVEIPDVRSWNLKPVLLRSFQES